MSGAGDLLSNMGNSVTGNIEKARLTLFDYRYLDTDDALLINEYSQGRTAVSVVGFNGYTSRFVSGMDEVNNSMLEPARMKAMMDDFGTKTRTFIVKFNPSTINFSATGGGKQSINNYDGDGDANDESGLKFGALPVRVYFSVQLIFDSTQNFEFTKNAVSTLAGKKENISNSVRKQVEGFIAALCNKRTRMLRFDWGKMSYRGVMNSVSADYTMFSPEGYPQRAHVNLSMGLVDESIYKGNMGWWKEKVEKVFNSGIMDGISSDANAVTNNVNPTQYVESLFNISL